MACSLLSFTDFLDEFLKSRKKKISAFKAGKSKAKLNDFEISDDESKPGRKKRVSFLKTQRISSSSENLTTSESREIEPAVSPVSQHNDYNNSFSSHHSTNVSEDNTQCKNSDGGTTDPEIARESSTHSLSYQTEDMFLPLLSDNSVMEPSGPEEKSNSVLEESSQAPQLSASDLKHLSSAGLFTLVHMQITKGQIPFYLPTVVIQIVLLRGNHPGLNRGKGLLE